MNLVVPTTDTCKQPSGDINECFAGNGGCAQVCTNTVDSFTCSDCPQGFGYNSEAKTCDPLPVGHHIDETTLAYTGNHYDIGMNSATFDIYLTPDGSKFIKSDYVDPTFSLKSYRLSTPFDLGTAQTDKVQAVPGIMNFMFSPDGLNLYHVTHPTLAPPPRIVHYTLAAPWDISGMTLANTFTMPNLGEGVITFANNRGIDIDPTGTRLYFIAHAGNYHRVYQYNLPAPWSIAGMTYVGSQLFEMDTFSRHSAFRMSTDGLYLYSTYSTSTPTSESERVFIYQMGTAFDIATLTYKSQYDVSPVQKYIYFGGLHISYTSNKMYIGDISNASPSPEVYVHSFSKQ